MNESSCFTTKYFKISYKNTERLWSDMNLKEKETFSFSTDFIIWDIYLETQWEGIKKYLFKEKTNQEPKGKTSK